MFEIVKRNTKIDFMGYTKFYFIFSGILILGTLILLFTKGFNYGVDFSGGTVVQVRFSTPPSTDEIRTVLDKSIDGQVSIQNFGEATDFLIKVENSDEALQVVSDKIQTILITSFEESGTVEIQRVEQVGPQVGKQLKQQAVFAVIYAIIGILLYVAFRFEFLYAFGSIIALVHDIILTIGLIIVTNTTFDLTVLAAILTVIGYSLNDKIVIFDRIREKHKLIKGESLRDVMNLSLNETLSRTLLTSVSTLIAVLALYLFGGEVIRGFALVMFVGVIIGTYSSIGISSATVCKLRDIFPAKEVSKKDAKKSS